MSGRKALALVSALAGVGLLAWLILRVGPGHLWRLWETARSILPIVVVLAGLRYVLQAAGWRLAMRAADRPGWRPTLAGVVAGEASGYVAGGVMAREPVKLLFVRDRVAARVAITAAAVERLASINAGAILVTSGLMTLAAKRAPHMLLWGPGAAVVTAALVVRLVRRFRARRVEGAMTSPPGLLGRALGPSLEMAADLWRTRRPAVAVIAALGLGQEAINVTESYLVLAWIGAAPALATVVAFEGLSRALNIFAQFVPGRIGVSEATATVAAGAVHLNPALGLSLALVRRARSLLWAVIGLTLLIGRNIAAVASRRDARPAGGGRSSCRILCAWRF